VCVQVWRRDSFSGVVCALWLTRQRRRVHTANEKSWDTASSLFWRDRRTSAEMVTSGKLRARSVQLCVCCVRVRCRRELHLPALGERAFSSSNTLCASDNRLVLTDRIAREDQV
jgi:hypothetical protein